MLIVNGDDEFGPTENSNKSEAPREETEPRNSRSVLSTRRRELELIADPLKMNGTKGEGESSRDFEGSRNDCVVQDEDT